MNSTVSLCMIVRNEKENLATCLRAVRQLVAEIVVVDTGSTDGTPNIAAQWGARVYDFPWCDDFAAARNESRRHATGDWVLWLDADDHLDRVNVERLGRLLGQLDTVSQPDTTAFVMTSYSPLTAIRGLGYQATHLRLFPRAAPVAWTGRVHERLQSLDNTSPTPLEPRWSDVVIQHVGYEDPQQRRRKLRRNLRLLQLDFAERPDDPTTLFHIGWCYLDLGNFTEAFRFLKRSLRCPSQADAPHLRKTHALMTECLSLMQRPREALELCSAAAQQHPFDTELLFWQGKLRGEVGDLDGAEACFLQLLTTSPNTPFQYGEEVGLRGAKTRFMLGLLYEEQHRVWEAEFQYRAAVAERPDYAAAWVGLGQLYQATGRTQEINAVIEHLSRCPGGELMAPTLQARQRILEHRFDEARQLLEQVIARNSEFLWPRLVLCDLLFACGNDWPRCVQMHRQTLQAIPNHTQLRQRLEWLLAHPPAGLASSLPARLETAVSVECRGELPQGL